MDLSYIPPTQDEVECGYLRRNFLTCLKEKALKDEVQKMNCNVENILWFSLECPDVYRQFKKPQNLRKTFIEEKNLETGPNPPKWIRLG